MLKIVALKLKKVKMLSPSRFTVNPILLPVENDPFRSQFSTLTAFLRIGLHSPLDLQFHQKEAAVVVLTTDASQDTPAFVT